MKTSLEMPSLMQDLSLSNLFCLQGMQQVLFHQLQPIKHHKQVHLSPSRIHIKRSRRKENYCEQHSMRMQYQKDMVLRQSLYKQLCIITGDLLRRRLYDSTQTTFEEQMRNQFLLLKDNFHQIILLRQHKILFLKMVVYQGAVQSSINRIRHYVSKIELLGLQLICYYQLRMSLNLTVTRTQSVLQQPQPIFTLLSSWLPSIIFKDCLDREHLIRMLRWFCSVLITPSIMGRLLIWPSYISLFCHIDYRHAFQESLDFLRHLEQQNEDSYDIHFIILETTAIVILAYLQQISNTYTLFAPPYECMCTGYRSLPQVDEWEGKFYVKDQLLKICINAYYWLR